MNAASSWTRCALLALGLAGGLAHAGLDDGLNALRRNDFATAARELRPLADRGNAEAQYRIGLMVEFGKGYPQDKPQGIAWFTKAASQGHTGAQQELGVIYATGDGVAKNDAQAAAWFAKAAELGDATAQYNLGLLYAKGAGVAKDDARAIAWFGKSAAQGFALAQFKLGVAYENGEGVDRDLVLAYASYAIAARNGSKDGDAYRADIATVLTPAQVRNAQALADAWKPGQTMPSPSAPGLAAARPHTDRCSASGSLGGDRFTATHCAVSLYGDQHSVAIWFNEQPITADEVKDFESSSYAKADPGGKQRTLVQVMFCPGGGKDVANATAVKAIDFNSNHSKSPIDGVQWSLEAGKDFKVDKLGGELKPGGVLAGHISGARGKTSFVLDFDLKLPDKDAAAGLSCGA